MSGIFCCREEVLGPLEADVFIGLSEEEQNRRHIANVEAPSDKDVNISNSPQGSTELFKYNLR